MKRLLLMLSISWSLSLQAQQNTPSAAPADTMKMSLQDCIDYALKNNINLKNTSLDEQIANARIGEVRAAGLPQVTGSVAVQHNTKLRGLYGQSSPTSAFAPRNEDGTPKLQDGQLFSIPNLFQLPDAIDASVTISQLIFSGSYIVGLQAAKTYRELSQKSVQQSKIQTTANVTKAYYMALINLERMNLFDSNILRVDSSLNQLKAMNKQGFTENIDVDRLEVTLNNLITEREKFINMVLLSNVLLKYQMNMPVSNNIVLADKLNALTIDESIIKSEAVDYKNRIEYQQLLTSKRLQQLDVKNNRWSYLPSIQASANFGVFTQNSDFFKLFTGSNFAPGYSSWANYGLIQIGMNVPIFAGFGKMYKTQQSKLTLTKTENSIKNFEQTIDLQTKQSELNLKNSLKSLETQKRNMKLAQSVAVVTGKKYKLGVGANLDVIVAESALKEAQVNYYNALYDAITYKVDYDLAIGAIK